MKPITKITLIALLVIAVAGFSVVGIASAEGDHPPRGREALAELLGLTPDELREQLQDGKTIEELAEEAGVDLDEFKAEMAANRLGKLEDRIQEALDNGDISQDHADWLLEGLEKGYLDGPFIGRGGKEAGNRPGDGSERPQGRRGGGTAE